MLEPTTVDITGDDEDTNKNYAWEEEYKRSWDILQEDDDGTLDRLVNSLKHQRKRKRCVLLTKLAYLISDNTSKL